MQLLQLDVYNSSSECGVPMARTLAPYEKGSCWVSKATYIVHDKVHIRHGGEVKENVKAG